MVMSDPRGKIALLKQERTQMPTYTVNFEGYTIVVAPDEEIARDKVEEQLMSVTSDLWITAVEE